MSKRTELDGDLVEEILLNLPVKSLARFKCVSRTWGEVISDQRFCRKHSQGAQKNILLLRAKDPFPVRIGRVVNNTCKPFMELENIDYLGGYGSISEAAHCDGLFCLGFSDENQSLLLWNPSTKEVQKLRPPGLRSAGKRIRGESLRYIGFGYDHEIGDYKVVSFLTNPTRGKILALKSGIWRDIDMEAISGPWVLRLPHQECISFDGKILWLGWKKGTTIKEENVVLCFDLVTEKFSEVTAPPISLQMNPSCLRLVGGNLCLIQLDRLKKKIQMWVTKDLRAHWNKVMALSSADLPDTELMPSLPGLMSFTNDGEFLISLNNDEEEERFYVYKTEDKKTFRRVQTKDRINGFPYIYEFVSSLVSVQCARKREREQVGYKCY